MDQNSEGLVISRVRYPISTLECIVMLSSRSFISVLIISNVALLNCVHSGPTESTSRKNTYEINNLRIHNDVCILNASRAVLDISALTAFI